MFGSFHPANSALHTLLRPLVRILLDERFSKGLTNLLAAHVIGDLIPPACLMILFDESAIGRKRSEHINNGHDNQGLVKLGCCLSIRRQVEVDSDTKATVANVLIGRLPLSTYDIKRRRDESKRQLDDAIAFHWKVLNEPGVGGAALLVQDGRV